MPAAVQPAPNRQQASNVGVLSAPERTAAYSSVNIHYLKNSPIVVRGPVSGRQYQFSSAHPDQPVDARDANALLRTRFFRRS
jgi:hypothetical protein